MGCDRTLRTAAMMCCLTLTTLASAMCDGADFFGAWEPPTGDAAGGGRAYSRTVTGGDYTVSGANELIAALADAAPGQTVYVADDAIIDLSDAGPVTIPGGVTLASGRNGAERSGAIIYSVNVATRPMFSIGGDDVRITGLRLRGPDLERRTEQVADLFAEGGHTSYYSIPNSDGIICAQDRLEVDNCEIYGWSHGGVFLTEGANDAYIHHNHIHHNQRAGLGYGVCLDAADALIEANIFDWCRHHIAGTGRPGTSYEARYNIVFEHANGHSFDMHGGADRGDGTHVAGTEIYIHHNLFMATDVPAVVIRGVPEKTCEVHHNWFFHHNMDGAVRQSNATGNMTVTANCVTVERIAADDAAVAMSGGDHAGVGMPPTGEPFGGGAGYSRILDGGDHVAGTKDELIAALAAARSGEVVFVPNDTIIDMTGDSGIVIPAGVTLAGGRNGSPGSGALIYTLDPAARPLFSTGGEGVRVTGIRLRGAFPDRGEPLLQELLDDEGRPGYYKVPTADGIITTHNGLEVDNCELYGWSHAAVFPKEGAEDVHVHHNYIHHNQRAHLGYGVCLDSATALVEGNIFDWCRHHIAGTGRPGTSYEARYNIVLPNRNSHSFDMHGGRDRKDGTDIAGDWMMMHHNLFLGEDGPSIVIRGVPDEIIGIYRNWFMLHDPGAAARQTNKTGRMTVTENVYTRARLFIE